MADFISTLSLYLQNTGGIGIGFFYAVFVAGSLLFFPASLLTALSGWLFGVTGGTLIALLAGLTSSLIAFGLARSRLFPLASRAAARSHYLNRALTLSQHNGIVLVLLLRLSSVVPFAPLNYGLGASGMSFKKYLAATVPGLIPGTFIYAGAGASVSDVRTLTRGNFSPMEFMQDTMMLPGLAAAAVGLVLLYLLQRSIRKKMGI
ncbi:TVP38/TMEM64 family protein [Pantoea sp. paga]|uniref:TVP38/TMEM64 family protein n=1 Tax=Pantoea TaxID=53335 RepID=UPI0011808771|nr:VTT domain-containing protein [Pantoea sp. paga]TSH82237.1 TVP38/TMEM64 family protein [Pantoea sp. paga]